MSDPEKDITGAGIHIFTGVFMVTSATVALIVTYRHSS